MKLCVVFCVVVSLVTGTPVPLNTQECATCSEGARSLLDNLSHIMEKEGKMKQDLFAGFNCTEQTAQMIPHTETAAICQPNTPANMTCSNQRNSSFSATACLKSIRDDLHYYDIMLKSYVHTDAYKHTESDLSPVITATHNLLNCLEPSCTKMSAERVLPEWVVWRGSSFDDRLSLCKTLRGFHVRVITVNRALRYITSRDYRK
ncbi:interleukin-12 subunit alpha [Myxocyprinus asiaticus]|uniref:interleukin-12 subunit alpha n=1 Tax=Myxocyprinus asiaticus TaxID=70543 RepID=UPI002221E9D1|nr:interleukin-12 subunit alpha [Myxocyprinus asiaticus]